MLIRMRSLVRVVEVLFPEREISHRKWSMRGSIVFFLVSVTFFYGVALFLPADGFIAFDWVHVFSQGKMPLFYPLWSRIVSNLNWPLLVSLSMTGILLATIIRSVHPVSSIATLLSLPVLWTIFLGQLEGLVVLGILGLPYLTPLAIIKPQVSFFAFGAKKTYLLAFLVWFGMSLIVWGWWPGRMFALDRFYAEGRYVQDIAIGWAGIFVALPMMWFSRGDVDMLMIGGAFVTPHLIPYNMLPFTTAIARIPPKSAVTACLLSWLPLSANWLGKSGWWLGWLYVIWLWLVLAYQRYSKDLK